MQSIKILILSKLIYVSLFGLFFCWKICQTNRVCFLSISLFILFEYKWCLDLVDSYLKDNKLHKIGKMTFSNSNNSYPRSLSFSKKESNIKLIVHGQGVFIFKTQDSNLRY